MSAQISPAIVTGMLALLSAGVLALLNSWISVRAGKDENLRSQRLEFYPTLWSATEVLSRWHRIDVTRDTLEELQQTLRSWYYTKGGLFLSESTAARYDDVQELIASLLAHNGDPADVLVQDRYTDLMATTSALRTALTLDLNTWRRTSLRENLRRSRWHARTAKQATKRITQATTSASTWMRRVDVKRKEARPTPPHT